MALEKGGAPADALESLMRDVHTIKGAAGMVGLDDVRALAHAVEDVLASLGDAGFRPELTDVLLRSADTLRRQTDGAEESGDDLIGELALAARATAADAPAPAVAKPVPVPSQAAAAADRRSIRVAPEKLDTLLDLVG